MEFSISEQQKMVVNSVRQFREKELMPLEREFLLAGKLDKEVYFDLEQKGREQGFWAIEVPTEYRGLGLGMLTLCMIDEELYKHPMMFEFGGSPEPALYLCNESQKKEYFYPVIDGEKHDNCYAFTEPDAGSDFAGIRTTAVRKGDDWVINGTKIFISHVDRADFVIVFASTNREAGAHGVSVFLVDKDSPGFEVSRQIPCMGDGWAPFELHFNDCVVPDRNLLGEVNGGFAIADHQLTHGRHKIAAFQLGIAQRSIDLAVEWAKNRTTWGKPLATRQAIQWMLADSEVELEAARLLVYRAAWMADNNQPSRNEAFMGKLYACEMSQRVTDRCLQIFGGMGYTREVPIQSFYRQVRVWRIGHGTSEIHRWMIARNMLGLSART